MKQKDLSGRLARWAIRLQGFSFEIMNRKGTQNVVADTLSRRDEIVVNEIHGLGPMIDMSSKEFMSQEYEELTRRIQDDQSRLTDLRVDSGYIYKRLKGVEGSDSWKLWVPSNLRDSVLYRAHDPCGSAHLGMGRMAQKLKQFFFWPGMITQTRSYISNCPTCKSTKGANLVLRPPMGRPIVSKPLMNIV